MKKIIAVILAMILIVGCFSTSAFAVEEEELLQFGEDGKFTVLHLTDIQDTYMFKEKTRKYINNILSMTNPDLIVLGGDNIAGFGSGLKCGVRTAIDNFMSIFEERGIKVAMVFGNHDDEGQATKQDMMELGLSGSSNADANRKVLLKKLDLPAHMSSNAMLQALNLLLTPDELRALLQN